MLRRLAPLGMLALSIAGAMLLVSGHFVTACLCYAGVLLIWQTAGRPTSFFGGSSATNQAPKPQATRPAEPAQVVTPPIGGHVDDAAGSFDRLQPGWKAWLNDEARSLDGE
jgi:hypothetical protein